MKKTEKCIHCNAEYTPSRVGHQKHCSKSCKSRRWYLKNKALQESSQLPEKIEKKKKKKEAKVIQKPDSINLPDIGNAALGVTAFETVKNLFTPTENKAVTKKDLQELKSFIIGRYLPIHNIAKDNNGNFPYYDVETGNVVYLFDNQII